MNSAVDNVFCVIACCGYASKIAGPKSDGAELRSMGVSTSGVGNGDKVDGA